MKIIDSRRRPFLGLNQEIHDLVSAKTCDDISGDLYWNDTYDSVQLIEKKTRAAHCMAETKDNILGER